jgi:hypothetical protein
MNIHRCCCIASVVEVVPCQQWLCSPFYDHSSSRFYLIRLFHTDLPCILTRQIPRGGQYTQYNQWTPGANASAGGGNMSPRVFEVHAYTRYDYLLYLMAGL